MKRFPALLAFALLLAAVVAAQQPLTNDSIVRMSKAGLNDSVIINVVNSQAGQYSLGPDDLVALKKADVSENVIAALLKRGAAAKSAGSTSGLPPVEAGQERVFAKVDGKWQAIEPEKVNWAKASVIKRVSSVGKTKIKVSTGRIDGIASRNEVTALPFTLPDSRPVEFLVYVPRGTAIGSYQLLQLYEAKDSYREFRTVLAESAGVDFDSKEVAPGAYLITLARLAPGQYGFLSTDAARASQTSDTPTKMFTFSMIIQLK